MRFGKRLTAEAARRWSGHYFDYKAIKKAIKEDIDRKDTDGTSFQRVLVAELQKVSSFYSDKAAELEKTLLAGSITRTQLSLLRTEIQELIKYVALNYIAVVKAIKKRNRHLKEHFGDAVNTSLKALDLLGDEVFFTSPRLAALSTQAEVLMQQLLGAAGALPRAGSLVAPTASAGGRGEQQSQLLEDYQCPICLETLHNPVVLTCAHRFCWGCLVAHTTSTRNNGTQFTSSKDQGQGAAVSSYRVLERIAASSEEDAHSFYNCPVCRKPQLMGVESLQVDTYLNDFVEGLKAMSKATMAQEQQPWGIIPPQAPQHKGKLCVLLDLDGTLVSSFTPKRAPRLPSYVKTHLVGVGSKLNPQGVLVVERPGLGEFLRQLAAISEVIVFTAGLEDYAKGIIDAIDPQGKLFAGRIYREGTLRTEYYQCVKDMGRLNRPLGRTILVDDTPLAFLHQPDNGVPVLGFRGDPDDRLLLEAVLPLIQSLVPEEDVRPVLAQRFDMASWFKQHGLPIEDIMAEATAAAAQERVSNSRLPCAPVAVPEGAAAAAAVAAPKQGVQGGAAAQEAEIVPEGPASAEWLLLMDFDKTLTDFDIGERVVEELAPELLPALVGMPTGLPAQNFVPTTNTVLAELQRRGVSRDQLLSTLQGIGAAEVSAAAVGLLREMSTRQIDVKLVSDANSVFINHVLTGAKAATLVGEVITNTASFERVELAAPSGDAASTTASSGLGQQQQRAAEYKLVVQPHHSCSGSSAACAPHGCALCPENLCKGHEVRRLRRQGRYRRILYVGDGANDVCASLALGPRDVVLARRGHFLADYMQRATGSSGGSKADAAATVAAAAQQGAQQGALRRPQASVMYWTTHEELSQTVQKLTAADN